MTSEVKSDHKNLAASIGRNTVFGVVARVVQLLTRLITIPIVIAHLGLGGYGIWSIIMATAAYMRFGSVGVKSAFQKYVAEAVTTGNYSTVNRLLSTGCGLMLIISVVGLLPVAAFSTRVAIASGVPSEFLTSSAEAITMLALMMVIANVGAVFEAIVMGGHRIDIARTVTTVLSIGEAVFIVLLLHYGFGLFAMAAVMAASELIFIASCYVAAKRVVPQIRVSPKYLTSKVIRELLRFAGTYQLRSVLEVLYLAIVPITILRAFGAEASGVYALANRLLTTAMTAADAFLLPILTGGTAVFVAGSAETMKQFIAKSFKVAQVLALLPLTFISVFGTKIILAWIGHADPSIRGAIWLVCFAGLWKGLSILGIVLYRASGNVLFDNLQQGLRICILVGAAAFAHKLGFTGILSSLAFAEFAGFLFILFALGRTFEGFSPAALWRDTGKIAVATVAAIIVGALAARMPLPLTFGVRGRAAEEVVLAFVGFSIGIWPILRITKSLSAAEAKSLASAILPRRRVLSATP